MKISWRLHYLFTKLNGKNPEIIVLNGMEFHIIKFSSPENLIAGCSNIFGIYLGPLYESFTEDMKEIILYHELGHYASLINSIIKTFSKKKSEHHADYWAAKKSSPQRVIKLLEKLKELESQGIIKSNLKTHPSLQERINYIKKKFKINN